MYVVVFFEVPVAREVIGFVYLTFIPGFICVKLLRLDELGTVVSLVFSVGFGIALLMFVGLFVNIFFQLLNIPEPLSPMNLLIVLNSFILLGGAATYLKSENSAFSKLKALSLPPLTSLLFLFLPVLSIAGAMLVNIYATNLVLLFVIFSIALLFSVAVLSKRFLPIKFYPLAVIMIAVAILFHSSLISYNIVTFGSDIPGEFLTFGITKNSGYWSTANPFSGDIGFGRYNAMLSVTILPTVYSNLLNMDPTWIFKIITPLLFSFVPVILYYVWREQMGSKVALFSAFLFMAQGTFYTEMLGLQRQMIAEFFLALLLLLVFSKKLKPSIRTVCFVFFGAALVVSHYALAELFLLFMFTSVLAFIILKRRNSNLTVPMLVLFSIIMFGWYIYTSSGATFDSFVTFLTYLSEQFGGFLSASSRGNTVMLGLGIGTSSPTIWNTFSRTLAYITEILVIIGFIGFTRQRIKNRRFADDYFIFTGVALSFLFALVVIPGLANSFNMTRFYHVLLFLLAPICILGGQTLVRIVSKQKKAVITSLFLLAILIPYFLFQTSFVYEITGTDNWSISLSSNRMSPLRLYYDLGYIDTYSLFGAQWLGGHVNLTSSIYSDDLSIITSLRIYGLIYRTEELSNMTKIEKGGVIYLNTLNVVYGEILGFTQAWNYTDLSPIFDDSNLIYSNGGNTIYQHAG
jgi:uncharacterized membrane protein